MFTIAICDDDHNICLQLESMSRDILSRLELKTKIDVFYSGQKLKNQLVNGSTYDLLLLDIELDSIKGMDIGELIREDLELENINIVYISGKPKYARELFKTRPLEFLDKPIEIKQLEDVFIRALKLFERNQKVFEYKTGNSFNRVRYKDIAYFESDDKKIIIHLIGNKCPKYQEFYGKLSDIEDQLTIDFIKIHKSYIVNYYNVKTFEYDTVEMLNNKILSISQSRRQEVRKKILMMRKKTNG